MHSPVEFGTDGVRGVANRELTPEIALRLGGAAAHVLLHHTENRSVVVGGDTRVSTDMLSAALMAGLAATGCRVCHVGVAPTPAVSRLTGLLDASAGAVISASHNPFEDNGIKFFGADGGKLHDDVEEEIEAAYEAWDTLPRPTGAAIGRIESHFDLVERYVEAIREQYGVSLAGMRIVLDCSNGATSAVAPEIFRSLGADVTAIHIEPDGININDHCGSTRPASMCLKVREVGAQVGLAFDGDGDRVMLCDEHGEIVDGDRIMALCAIAMHQRGELPGDVVVATIMSNAGLDIALEREGITLLRTDVGDRYVAAEMARSGAVIGGEQSGHVLFPALSPTGDGVVTALQVLGHMVHSGRQLSSLASVVHTVPQILRNVRVHSKAGWLDNHEIRAAIETAKERVGKPEWVSVRASGTEPLIRVMVQDTDEDRVEQITTWLCEVVQRHCGV
jgi:phosphoglucosamine mutase